MEKFFVHLKNTDMLSCQEWFHMLAYEKTVLTGASQNMVIWQL